MNKSKITLLKIDLFWLSFFIFIVFAGRYGVPYLFEEYGMPGEAVVTNLDKDSHGRIIARYNFVVNEKLYRGSVLSHRVQEGDTILIWYFLPFPWINECHEESVIK